MIARRFPASRYPQVVFKPINKKIVLRQRPPERVPIPQSAAQVKRNFFWFFFVWIDDSRLCFAQLQLPDGLPTDVLVTSVVSCNHIFVQQTSHPTAAELPRLDNSMSVFYHHTEVTPHLPRPIQGKSNEKHIEFNKPSMFMFFFSSSNSWSYLCCTNSDRLVSCIDHIVQQ